MLVLISLSKYEIPSAWFVVFPAVLRLWGGIPLGFVATAAYKHPDEAYSGSLGRLSLIALTIGFAVFFARVLNPERGALHGRR